MSHCMRCFKKFKYRVNGECMEDESNPWPGFVDTFSTMLCIFIFLMLVFILNNMLVMYENSVKAYSNAVVEEESTKKQDVMAKNTVTDTEKTKDTSLGKNVGTFDTASGDNIEITTTDEALTIIYHGKVSSYLTADIEKIASWTSENKSKQFNLEIHVQQLNKSYSDTLRIGYERGIILMKEIKSISPSLSFNMSVNVELTDSVNKIVITKENK